MAKKLGQNKKSQNQKGETVKQKSQRLSARKPKTRRLKNATSAAATPLKSAFSKHYFLYNSKGKYGKFLNKPRRFTPKYFRESWAEIKLVTWPNRKETIKLTMAVVIFALIFGAFVGAIDYVFEKLFREVIL